MQRIPLLRAVCPQNQRPQRGADLINQALDGSGLKADYHLKPRVWINQLDVSKAGAGQITLAERIADFKIRWPKFDGLHGALLLVAVLCGIGADREQAA